MTSPNRVRGRRRSPPAPASVLPAISGRPEPATSLSDAPTRFIDPAELPDLYGMRVAGDCMLPLFDDGAILHFDKREPVGRGDLVILFRRPELVQPGELQARVKRLVLGIPPFVTFPWEDHPNSNISPIVIAEMLNPPRTFQIRCSHLLAVHKCVRVLP